MFYKEFDLDNFDAIQAKLVPHVLSFCSEFTQFWNHADVTELLSVVPELEIAIYNMVGQRPFKSYVLAIKAAPLDALDATPEYAEAIDAAIEKYNPTVKVKGSKVKAKPSMEDLKARAQEAAEA